MNRPSVAKIIAERVSNTTEDTGTEKLAQREPGVL